MTALAGACNMCALRLAAIKHKAWLLILLGRV